MALSSELQAFIDRSDPTAVASSMEEISALITRGLDAKEIAGKVGQTRFNLFKHLFSSADRAMLKSATIEAQKSFLAAKTEDFLARNKAQREGKSQDADASFLREQLARDADNERAIEKAKALHALKNPTAVPSDLAKEITSETVASLKQQINDLRFAPQSTIEGQLALVEKGSPDGPLLKSRLALDIDTAKMTLEGKVLDKVSKGLGTELSDDLKIAVKNAVRAEGAEPARIMEMAAASHEAEQKLNSFLADPKKAASSAAIPLVQQAQSEIAALKGAKAVGTIERAAEAVTLSRFSPSMKLLGGGALAAILLPTLLSMRGKATAEEPSVPQQIQLLQALNQQQQQSALVQSLINSRQSVADRNSAQTDLLRLKAMSQGGGGGIPLL